MFVPLTLETHKSPAVSKIESVTMYSFIVSMFCRQYKNTIVV